MALNNLDSTDINNILWKLLKMIIKNKNKYSDNTY